VLLFEPLSVELNRRTTITNSTLTISDFDTNPEQLTIYIEKFPRFGRLFKSNTILFSQTNNKFTYADILEKNISVIFDDSNAKQDEIHLRVSDGSFEASNKFIIYKKQTTDIKNAIAPSLEKNEGLQAIAGKLRICLFCLKIKSRFTIINIKYHENNYKNQLKAI
jgi:hypothetical protein